MKWNPPIQPHSKISIPTASTLHPALTFTPTTCIPTLTTQGHLILHLKDIPTPAQLHTQPATLIQSDLSS